MKLVDSKQICYSLNCMIFVGMDTIVIDCLDRCYADGECHFQLVKELDIEKVVWLVELPYGRIFYPFYFYLFIFPTLFNTCILLD